MDLFCLVLVYLVQETLLWYARAAGPVDDDRLACLIYIVLHAKVGRHPMDQHTVVGRHMRELLKGTIAGDEVDHVLLQFKQHHAISGVAVEGVDDKLVQVYAGRVSVLQAGLFGQ